MTPLLPFRLLDLPVELHDHVLSFMETESLIAYTLAAYAFLAARRQKASDYPPLLTRTTLRTVAAKSASIASSALSNQPSEVALLYMRHLSHRDKVAFALAEYHSLRKMNITPPVDLETVNGLRVVTLRGG